MSIDAERDFAANSLYRELTAGMHTQEWFRGVGTPKGTEMRQIFVYVKARKDLKRLPKTHHGFEVVGTVIGDIRM